uniref:Putative secreted protein n=1 Tax=Anopheles triannulatus TaxID=58253 RepID=A0A2M4B6L3_9DIPT
MAWRCQIFPIKNVLSVFVWLCVRVPGVSTCHRSGGVADPLSIFIKASGYGSDAALENYHFHLPLSIL